MAYYDPLMITNIIHYLDDVKIPTSDKFLQSYLEEYRSNFYRRDKNERVLR